MSLSRGALLIGLLATCISALAQSATAVPVKWEWMVVSTPDSPGPFRGKEPGFKAPIPKEPLPATLRLTRGPRYAAQFELIVSTTGRVTFEKTLRTSGRNVEARATEVLKKWQLEPAMLDGKPIRVRLRVFVEGG